MAGPTTRGFSGLTSRPRKPSPPARPCRRRAVPRAVPCLPEAADGAVDEPRVQRPQPLLPAAELLGHAGRSSGCRHGLGDQGVEDLAVAGVPRVELDAALFAVVRLVVPGCRPALEGAEGVARLRLLDLDDVGPEVAEQHAAGGARDDVPCSTTLIPQACGSCPKRAPHGALVLPSRVACYDSAKPEGWPSPRTGGRSPRGAGEVGTPFNASTGSRRRAARPGWRRRRSS